MEILGAITFAVGSTLRVAALVTGSVIWALAQYQDSIRTILVGAILQ